MRRSTVTATAWAVSADCGDHHGVPGARLNIFLYLPDEPNDFGGVGSCVKHPTLDGLMFPTSDAAFAFAERQGFLVAWPTDRDAQDRLVAATKATPRPRRRGRW